jgi:transposase
METKMLQQRDEVLEKRRFQAWELKQKGWKQAKIAEELGVTPGAVSQWLKRAREEGRDALHTRKGGGPKPRLREEQIRQLPGLLAKGPQAYGFRGGVWTRARIIAVIQQVFGVEFSSGHIGRIMRKSGVQLRRSIRRNGHVERALQARQRRRII